MTRPRQEQGVGWGWWAGVALVVPLTVFACQWYGRGDATPKPPPPETFIAATPVPQRALPVPAEGVSTLAEATRLMAAGDLPGAATAFARAVELEPENASYRKAYGDCLLRQDQVDDAIEQFAKAFEIEPVATAYATAWAKALEAQQRPEEAEAVYVRALGANPDDVVLWRGLAGVRLKQGNKAGAIDALGRAEEIAPGNAEVRYERGAMLVATGRYEEAAETFSSVVDDDPRAPGPYAGLAESYLQLGRIEDALRAIDKGIAASPRVPFLRRTRGVVLEKAGRQRDAAKEYREYVRLAPNANDAAAMTERANKLEGLAR